MQWQRQDVPAVRVLISLVCVQHGCRKHGRNGSAAGCQRGLAPGEGAWQQEAEAGMERRQSGAPRQDGLTMDLMV